MGRTGIVIFYEHCELLVCPFSGYHLGVQPSFLDQPRSKFLVRQPGIIATSEERLTDPFLNMLNISSRLEARHAVRLTRTLK